MRQPEMILELIKELIMSRRVNDGDINGLKLDKFRHSRFEPETRESSIRFGGVSRATPTTINGPYAENRGRRSPDTVRSQWDGSPFENGRLYNWKNRQGWDEYYEYHERGNRNHGGRQLDHEGSHFGKGPKGYKRADESIYEDVCQRLELSSQVDASEIEVNVKDGIVYLTGSVQDRRTKRLAELEIENISGVFDVQNQLLIRKTNEELH